MRFDQWFVDFFNTLVYTAPPDTVYSHKAAYEGGYKQGVEDERKQPEEVIWKS